MPKPNTLASVQAELDRQAAELARAEEQLRIKRNKQKQLLRQKERLTREAETKWLCDVGRLVRSRFDEAAAYRITVEQVGELLELAFAQDAVREAVTRMEQTVMAVDGE